MGTLQIKRIQEDAGAGDGTRILVDRLWPRGHTKASVKHDLWLRDVAPSTELRRWFGHEPERWPEFRKRYFAELKSQPEAWAPIVDALRKSNVTLLFAAHDEEHNNAVALREFLAARHS
ncbi:MAG: DUF488 domain-containing protein [Bryobacterales bacterium]|nr:DUF488 domain-containing protein [Bryobacterales bacterium]